MLYLPSPRKRQTWPRRARGFVRNPPCSKYHIQGRIPCRCKVISRNDKYVEYTSRYGIFAKTIIDCSSKETKNILKRLKEEGFLQLAPGAHSKGFKQLRKPMYHI